MSTGDALRPGWPAGAGPGRESVAARGSLERARQRVRGPADLDSLRFDAAGLLPVVLQDRATGDVLMVAWANRAALERTLETGTLHFWSRSRRRLWQKGEASGHTQSLVSLHADCDRDTLLALVEPRGPACHTGEVSCFGEGSEHGDPRRGALGERAGSALSRVVGVVASRGRERPEGSYTTRLLEDENLRLKKLGEETAELIAALAKGSANAGEEAADLVYHLVVALEGAGLGWADVERALAERER